MMTIKAERLKQSGGKRGYSSIAQRSNVANLNKILDMANILF